MSNNNSNQQQYEYSKLGDDLNNDNIDDIEPDAARIKNEDISNILIAKKVAEMDGSVIDMIRMKSKTDALRKSIYNGDVQLSQSFTGTNKNKVDLNGWETVLKFFDIFKNPAKYQEEFRNDIVTAMIGSDKKGAKSNLGKSYTMYFSIEIMQRIRDIPDKHVFTSNKSDKYRDMPDTLTDYLTLIRNDDFEKIIGYDESAQSLQYEDQTLGKDISKGIKLARHNKTHQLFVTHTGMIPSEIRRQSIKIYKTSKRSGKVGFEIAPNKAGSYVLQDPVFEFQNQPKPNYAPDDLDLIILRDKEGDKDITPQCMATTSSGGDCPNDAVIPQENPVVCKNHRHKKDKVISDNKNEEELEL